MICLNFNWFKYFTAYISSTTANHLQSLENRFCPTRDLILQKKRKNKIFQKYAYFYLEKFIYDKRNNER